MKISVIGTGYVGLVTGVCLSEVGHEITCLDIDSKKVERLNRSESPIYEPGLEDMMKKNIDGGRLDFTDSYETALQGREVVIIAVGTPQADDGSAELVYLNNACRSIAENMTNDMIVVTKSTVPVGTNEHVKNEIEKHHNGSYSVDVISNPEFLREGSAIYDTFNGDRIVVGGENEKAVEKVKNIFEPFGVPIVMTDLRSAEMIKYASNAFLATKISFINQLSNLCERIGANVESVAKGMGMDKRIGDKFLNAGVGYGGSCFPKDTSALSAIAKSVDYDLSIVDSVIATNEGQQRIIVDKIKKVFPDLENKKIAVLGLAFKPNTDDMRDAPSIKVVRELVDAGADVYAYDPIASENARTYLPGATNYMDSVEEAIHGKDFAVIMTDWKEIKEYSPENYAKSLNNPVVFDGRNCYSLKEIENTGLEYHSIGRPTVYNK